MVHNILFTLLALEVNASIRGAVSVECPREVYAQLSWSEWSGENCLFPSFFLTLSFSPSLLISKSIFVIIANLPSEWTLFLPLNSRYIPHHDRNQDDDDINDSEEGENEEGDDNENTAIV